MLKVKKHTLLLVAGLVWLAAGINILRIGINSFATAKLIWLLIIIAIIIFTGFFFMFSVTVRKHKARILGYEEEKKSIFCFFDVKGYLMMAFMMGLGIGLRHGNFLPTEFFASFYTGLGSALCVAGIKFLVSYVLQMKKSVVE